MFSCWGFVKDSLQLQRGKCCCHWNEGETQSLGAFSLQSQGVSYNHLCSQKCYWLHADAVLHLMVLAINVRGLCYGSSLGKLRKGKSRERNNWWSSVSSRIHIAQFQSKVLFVKYPIKWTSWKSRGDSISASGLVTVPGQAGCLLCISRALLN